VGDPDLAMMGREGRGEGGGGVAVHEYPIGCHGGQDLIESLHDSGQELVQ
jgi:hypothetical protein